MGELFPLKHTQNVLFWATLLCSVWEVPKCNFFTQTQATEGYHMFGVASMCWPLGFFSIICMSEVLVSMGSLCSVCSEHWCRYQCRSCSLMLLPVMNQGWIYILPADLFSPTTLVKCVSLLLLFNGNPAKTRQKTSGLALAACVFFFFGTGTFILAVPFDRGRKWGVIEGKRKAKDEKPFKDVAQTEWSQKSSSRLWQ